MRKLYFANNFLWEALEIKKKIQPLIQMSIIYSKTMFAARPDNAVFFKLSYIEFLDRVLWHLVNRNQILLLITSIQQFFKASS